MKTEHILMRRLVSITRETNELPLLRQIASTVDYWGDQRRLNIHQRVAMLTSLVAALEKLTE